MRLTLLGTGTSMGVPQIGCSCPVCTSADHRDRRSRTAALIETTHGRNILIDTPPELRIQLTAQGTQHLDAVLYTHHHADHTNGIDDLRSFSQKQRADIPVFGSSATIEHLQQAFSYIFDSSPIPNGTSRPRVAASTIEPGTSFTAAGQDILPLLFEHGSMPVLGYRLGGLAYITDVKRVDDSALPHLRNLDILVLNALWFRPHPTHLSVDEAIATARRIAAKRTILTHLTHETSHQELLAYLPKGMEPGYDGMRLAISD